MIEIPRRPVFQEWEDDFDRLCKIEDWADKLVALIEATNQSPKGTEGEDTGARGNK